METLTQYLRRILPPADPAASDDLLLSAFVNTKDAEAFASLVQRHAPMVWATCRRVLDGSADAEDAFQATFLVLAKKADTVRPRRMLAGWLHGVSVNVAMKVRTHTMRRSKREKSLAEWDAPDSHRAAIHPDDLKRLDAAIAKLPGYLRDPIVLCELEGCTRKDAAKTLGIPEGTVASRVARAKQRLAKSLGAPALLATAWSAVIPPVQASEHLISQTTEAAVGLSVAAPAAASAVALAQEVLLDMFIRKLKILAVLAVGSVAIAIGASNGWEPAAKADTPKQQPSSFQPAPGTLRVLRPTDDVNFQLLQSQAVRKDLGLNEKDAVLIGDAFAKAEALWREKAKTNAAFNQAGIVVNNVIAAVPAQWAPAAPAAPPPAGALPAAAPIAAVGFPLIPENTTVSVSMGEKTYSEIFGEQSEFSKMLKPILTEKSIHRLRQLELTSKGASAFTNRRVVRYLSLTEEQEDAIELIIKKWNLDSRQFSTKLKELRDFQDQSLDVCVKTLSAEQKQKWELLVGKPIPTFDLLNFDKGNTPSGIIFSR